MNSRSGRRLLYVAIAISLVVHVVVAIGLHPPLTQPPDDTEVVTILRRSIAIHVVKTPPPPPHPQKTASPRAVPHKAPPKPKGTASLGSGGSARVRATPEPTPEPTAAATVAANACAHTDADAAVVATPAPVEIPAAVRAAGINGTAIVRVQLDAQGAVNAAAVAQSTGNSSLDLVAVAIARGSTYAAATHACKAVAGTYDFSVRFAAW
jgi:periplasmic protein TonB